METELLTVLKEAGFKPKALKTNTRKLGDGSILNALTGFLKAHPMITNMLAAGLNKWMAAA
jgi:hypothetical protein